jgi:ABC-type multidrug transport system ATPase subunit
VLDEPTNGLDPEGGLEMWALLRRLVDEHGVTVLISSHLLNEVEEACDRVAIIDKGRLVCCERVADLLRGGARRVAVQFIDAATAAQARERIAAWEGVALDRDVLAEADPARVVVHLSGLEGAAFNRRLFQEGLDFHFIQPADRTLKDYFLSLRERSDGGRSRSHA